MALVGKNAPDFNVKAAIGGDVTDISLSDYSGKWLVLFFYTKSNTGVCDTEMPAFAAAYPQFKEQGAEVLAISCNPLEEQQEYAAKFGGEVPVVSDETRDFSKAYGALNEANNLPWRSTIIVDADGVIQYEQHHFFKIGRDVNESLRMLSALQSGGACPVNWKAGESTL